MKVSPNSRLITFGDSWTQGHGIELDIHYKEVISPNPFIDKLRNGNGWPRHLATLLNLPFVNFGWCNYSNKNIIEEIEKNIKYFDDDDIIIVMLSYPYRDNGNPINDIKTITKLLSNCNYFLFNSFYKTFINESDLNSFNIDLSRFLDINLTMSSVLIEYEKEKNISVWEYNFRYPYNWQNTDGGDTHPNYLGYKIIANKIYELIKKYDNNTRSSIN